MYIEMLDRRPGSQFVDMKPEAALELIKQGRAKSINAPSPATPPLPGGYRGTTAAVIPSPEVPVIVASFTPVNIPLVAWDLAEHKSVKMETVPAAKAKSRR